MMRAAASLILLLAALVAGATASAASVVEVTTSAPDDPYGPTQTIHIQVVFNAAVNVDTTGGSPQLGLNTLGGGRFVNYSSGTGTAVLDFAYTISTGDSTPRLDAFSATALILNGSAITDAINGSVAVLALPVGLGNPSSLIAGHAIAIEDNTTDAVVTRIHGANPDGPYGVNATLTLLLDFDRPVYIDDTLPYPSMTLNSGTVSSPAVAAYAGGNGTSELSFTYTPRAGDAAADLDVTAINTSGIKDAKGPLLSATPPIPGGGSALSDTQNYKIDTVAPIITNVSATAASGTFGLGQTVTLLVSFSKGVVVSANGHPTVLLATNPNALAVFNGLYAGSASPVNGVNYYKTLEFVYTVGTGQNANPLDYIVANTPIQPFSPNGATIRDAGTNDADLDSPPTPAPGTGVPTAGALSVNTDLVVTTTAPTVSTVTVNATATPPGTYGPGTAIDIQVHFVGLANNPSTPNPVTVSGGTPYLLLDTGTSNDKATYASGSGSDTLHFAYTILPGDNASPLNYQSIASLVANGASVTDVVGNIANLGLPATNTAQSLANAGIVVHTPPAVISIGSADTSAGNTYKAGSVIPILVTFSAPVSVTGTPSIALNASAHAAAPYASGSGSATLTFDYTVGPGDIATPLDVTSTAALSGTITDLSGSQAAILALPAPASAQSLGTLVGLDVDGVAPTITMVSSTPSSAGYHAGQVIHITVAVSKPVTVVGDPELGLDVTTTGAPPLAACSGGTLVTSLDFAYTVQPGDSDAHLGTTGSALILPAGTSVVDDAGNPLVPTLPAAPNDLKSTTAIVIDSASAFVVSDLSSPANASYHPGQSIPISVTFSEAVTVSTAGGTPTLTMSTGGKATYTSGSGTAVLLFTYAVATTDPSGPLTTAIGALANGGGSITNAGGNPASLQLPDPTTSPSDVLAASAITLTTTPTTVVSIASTAPDGVYGVNAVIPLIVTFSGPVTVAGGTPTLLLNTIPTQGAATYAAGSGTTTLTFTYAVAANQAADTLDCGSSTALQLNGATMTDAFGLGVSTTVPIGLASGALPNTSQIAIETTAPTAAPSITSVTTTDANGSYLTGQTIYLVLNMTTPVTVTGTPELFLNDQGSSGALPFATYVIGSGTDTLIFAYTILNGQSTPQLDVQSTSALDLEGGSIADPFNASSIALPAPGSANSLSASAALAVNPNTTSSGKPPPDLAATPTTAASGSGCGLGGGTAALLGMLAWARPLRRRARR